MIPVVAGIAVIVFIALFVYAIAKGTNEFDQQRAQLLDAFAVRNGFESGDASRFDLREKIRDFAVIGVAENMISHAAWKEEHGARFYVFDQVHVTRAGSATRGGLLTICFVEPKTPPTPDTVIFSTANRIEAKLARSMSGNRVGLPPVMLGDKAFDDRFAVFSQDPDAIRRLLNERLKTRLLTETQQISQPITIQVRPNGIAVHNSGDRPKSIQKPEEMLALVRLAEAVTKRVAQ